VGTGPAGLGRTEPWWLRTEVAALRFLADDLGLGLAPRVVDLAAGLVVVEDLAPRAALDRLLRRDGAAAHADRLAAFARARGELSAATAGHAGGYRVRRASLGLTDPAADDVARFARLRDRAPAHAAALGVPLAGRVADEFGKVLAELSDPGPFLALSSGDAETNNVLVHESGAAYARLIDFESAGCTHALLDAVCLHVPGPMWMTVGDPVAVGLVGHPPSRPRPRRARGRGRPAVRARAGGGLPVGRRAAGEVRRRR
jgi:hypothetical protein